MEASFSSSSSEVRDAVEGLLKWAATNVLVSANELALPTDLMNGLTNTDVGSQALAIDEMDTTCIGTENSNSSMGQSEVSDESANSSEIPLQSTLEIDQVMESKDPEDNVACEIEIGNNTGSKYTKLTKQRALILSAAVAI